MIFDKLANIDKYPQIPNKVKSFIKTLKSDIELGRYDLGNSEFVNVEAYTTKKVSEAKFEVHRKYIDIQILIFGKERIYIKPVESLIKSLEFSSDKDIGFFEDVVEGSDFVTLDGSNFAIIFPNEAHAPQVSIDDNRENVKKVVVKLLF